MQDGEAPLPARKHNRGILQRLGDLASVKIVTLGVYYRHMLGSAIQGGCFYITRMLAARLVIRCFAMPRRSSESPRDQAAGGLRVYDDRDAS